jgi:hypothetical protein
VQVLESAGNVTVVMEQDDAEPLMPVWGRKNTLRRIRIRNPDAYRWEIFPVTKAGRASDGTRMLAYKSACSNFELSSPLNTELPRIVMLIVALFKKAAERYRAA